MPASCPDSWPLLGFAVVCAFFIGAVSPATIVASARHGDLRQGSGNPGATNAGRVLGLRWGVVVGVLDVLKGLVPTLVALLWIDRFTAYAVGLACVLGHILSPFLRGRGGKGVATSLGAVLAMFPWFSVAMLAVFALILWRTRWVAAASLGAAACVALWAGFGPLPAPVAVGRVWGLVVAVIVVARHRENIQRWVRGRLG